MVNARNNEVLLIDCWPEVEVQRMELSNIKARLVNDLHLLEFNQRRRLTFASATTTILQQQQ